jgi:hypothetical protein
MASTRTYDVLIKLLLIGDSGMLFEIWKRAVERLLAEFGGMIDRWHSFTLAPSTATFGARVLSMNMPKNAVICVCASDHRMHCNDGYWLVSWDSFSTINLRIRRCGTSKGNA